ncbi:MAG: MurR/RpiR family transcriptional regulator [Beijerinckiaceae bacterium]|nr:MurR/RpiR family transcriptional regulator [Beijerinckiaceae bacterium]
MQESFQHSPSPEIAFSKSELGVRLGELSAGRPGANRTIADYLLRNPIQISAWSIEEFALNVGVSTASLSRFARAIGFKGYPDLRSALAQTLRDSLHPVEKLRQTFLRGSGAQAAFSDGLSATLANIEGTAEGLRSMDLETIVSRLGAARTIYVMGFGLSSHLAALLSLNLQPFFNHLVNVVQYGGTEVAAGRLATVGKDDLLISISFPRYARDAIDLTRYARDRKAHVVAITDSPASPLARLCDDLLIAPSAHPVISSSCAPALVLIEALVTAFMASNAENVTHATKLTDAIANYIYRPESPLNGK